MKRKSLLMLAVIFTLVNAIDILLTWSVLSKGGIEANPIMAYVIEVGFWGSLVWKIALPAFITFLLVRYRKLAILTTVTAVVSIACIWNFIGLVIA